MPDTVLFEEKQYFRQWWIWLIFIPIDLIFIFGVIKQVIIGDPFGDKPAPDAILIFSLALVLSLTVLFYFLYLETQIKPDGIYVRFFPLRRSFRFYSWDSIDQAFVRQYGPISEYGGWGFRLGIFGSGKALNVSGDMGLQLIFKDGSRLLIGTQKPDEITSALSKLNRLLRDSRNRDVF